MNPEPVTGPMASFINVKLPNGKYINGVLTHMLPNPDFDNVNKALEQLPGLLSYISIMHADATYYYDVAHAHTAKTRATADLTIRAEADKKLTVSEVESRIELDESVQNAVSAELLAKYNRDILRAAVDTVVRALDSYKEISYNTRREATV